MSKQGLDGIKNILRAVVKTEDLDRKMRLVEPVLKWAEVAPTLAGRTHAVSLVRGTLNIIVSDAVLMHSLTFMKRDYIAKINGAINRNAVRDISFSVAELPRQPVTVESREDYMQRLDKVELSESDVKHIEGVICDVADADIKESLRELFTSQARLNKLRKHNSQ